MRQRTPQEKKTLSLEKDRRNVYGEAPHGARKIIPLRKKLRNRANRHQQEPPLPSAPIAFDADHAYEIESAMRAKALKRWVKSPDLPLSEVIAGDQLRRATSKASRSKIILGKRPPS